MKKYIIGIVTILGLIASPAFAQSISGNVDTGGYNGGTIHVDYSSTGNLSTSTYTVTVNLPSYADESFTSGDEYWGIQILDNNGSENPICVPSSTLTHTFVITRAYQSIFSIYSVNDPTQLGCQDALNYNDNGSIQINNINNYNITPTSTCDNSSILNATGTGCAIQNINGSTTSYFFVLLEKYWPFLVGICILIIVWSLGRKKINDLI